MATPLVQLGSTSLKVFPLNLGGNVFGWSANEEQSFAILDAFYAAGGNFIDTADMYSQWMEGNKGGESETIIGKWMAARGNRSKIIIATKVCRHNERLGLSAANIPLACADSLKRLQTDYIDLYYAHFDDPETSLEETMPAFDKLVKAGLVKHLGASNYSYERLSEALAISKRLGIAKFEVFQPHYNLVERSQFEGPLADLCAKEGIAVCAYFSLAKGFLTGKYRQGGLKVESVRAEGAQAIADTEAGQKALVVLDKIAADRKTTVSAVALAWLRTRPYGNPVMAIASARTVEQLADILPSATLDLSAEEVAALNAIV